LPAIKAPYTVEEVNKFIEEGYDLANGLEYKSEHNPNTVNEITLFNEVARIDANKTNTPIAVIKKEFDKKLEVNNSSATYITKGEEKTFDWAPGQTSFASKTENITELGTVKFIIADGGSYTLDGGIIANMDIIVANGGTLKIKQKIQMNTKARIIIMSGGTLIDENSNADQNNPSINHDAQDALLYNDGTIQNMKCLCINSAEFSNDKNGIITAKEIYMTNDDGVINNYGKIDVDKVHGNGEQGTLNNNCLFRSKEKIEFKYINQAANTAIECEYISFYELTLRDNSILRTNHLRANNTTISYQGTKDPALISVDNVDYVNVDNFNISGNIYFEANTYSEGKVGDEYGGFWKAIDDAIKVGHAHGIAKVGEANITIVPEHTGDDLTTADCVGRGNKPTNTPEPEPEAMSWILACEDLGGTDDFDFNDVVFSVSHVAGSEEAFVTPLAAGGTLYAEICYNNANLGEIHELLGSEKPVIMNTSSRGNAGEKIKITVPANFSMVSDNMGGFSIKVYGTRKGEEVNQVATVILAPVTGAVPQMICVPGDWAWPTERISISKAYPLFGEWGANYSSNSEWYKSPEESYIVK